MFLVPINYLAILACGILNMVLGFVWYGPLFGKEWSKLVGFTKEGMEKMSKDKNAMNTTYAASFISALVMAYALAHFVWFSAPRNTTLLIGAKTGLWAWIGFVVPYALSKFLFTPNRKPMKLFWIDTGYYLVSLVLMGMILSIWW